MGIADLAADVLIREAGTILDDVMTSEEERAELRIKMEQVRQAPELKALDERIQFAQHPSIFVAGGRPAVIWIAAVGIGFNVIVAPLLNWIGAMFAVWGMDGFVPMDPLDWDVLTVLAGLAGGASWVRHMDKVRGVARSNLRQPDISDVSLRGGGIY